MPARNAEATRTRILDAAVSEFAAHGWAGGRIDRIAEAAETNVRMIYAYFGNKSTLFDAAFQSAIRRLTDAVPPRPDDLAGWAGDLFDFHGRDNAPLRLALWAQLERPESGAEPFSMYLEKTATVSASPPLGAVDLLTIIYAIAQAWHLTPDGLLASDGSNPRDPRRIAAHRAAIVAAVARITAQPGG